MTPTSYYVWRSRYQINGKQNLTIAVWALALCRIILCMMPQNAWLSKEAPLSWGIYRNIPFTILGVLIVILFYKRICKITVMTAYKEVICNE